MIGVLFLGMPARTALLVALVLIKAASISHAFIRSVNFPVKPMVDLSMNATTDLKFDQMNDEQQLLRFILKYYDRSVRPVFNATNAVSVQIGLTLNHIFNVDEKKQVLSMNVWLEQEWIDERIKWSAEDFGDIKNLTVPTSFVWLPDIVLYNNAQDFSHGLAQTNVNIDAEGKVLWMPPVKFHSICKLDVTFFPFDDQICSLRFGSWIYSGSEVDVTNRSVNVTVDADSYIENGEWQVINTSVRKDVNFYPCCANTSFPFITFTLHLRRRMLFYLYNIIIPCIMLSILTMMQFMLPCESGEKITLGLTVLLAYSVFSFNIAENMPETSEVIPLVAIYLMCIMGISALSVTLSVIVLNMRHGGARKRCVPYWLKFFAYRIIGRIVCWHKDEDDKIKEIFSGGETSVRKALKNLADELSAQATGMQAEEGQSLPTSTSMQSETSPLRSVWKRGDDTSPKQRQERAQTTSSKREIFMTGQSPAFVMNNGGANNISRFIPETTPDPPLTSSREVHKAVLVSRAARLMERMENEKKGDELLHEWRKISRVFDQFFFALIFFVTVFITVFILIVAPRFNDRRLVDLDSFGK